MWMLYKGKYLFVTSIEFIKRNDESEYIECLFTNYDSAIRFTINDAWKVKELKNKLNDLVEFKN